MSKHDFVQAVAESAAVNQKIAEAVINATVEQIAANVAAGQDLVVQGLGTFTRVFQAERKGRNPSTGAEITIKATHKVKFKPAKPLRDAAA